MKISYTNISPNQSGKRTMKIDRITPHCVVGQLTTKTIVDMFKPKGYGASCNYAIGVDGTVGLCVEESNRSWCSSSSANDQRAVTIECASDKYTPYGFNKEVFQSLVELTADICKRNGKSKLVWIENKEKALAYKPADDEMLITVHRWFANKACPGDWLMNHMKEYKNLVNAKLADDDVYKIAKEWAVAKGLFKGDGKGNYRWNEPITRQEFATVLYRYDKGAH